ncbi:MAG: hypothetical protein P8013_02915 [Candidatus Sulfobium sp.]
MKKSKQRKVKALIVLEGLKQKDIARFLHVSTAMISLVVAGKKKSQRIRLGIIKILHDRGVDVEYQDLWPDNGNDHRRAA